MLSEEEKNRIELEEKYRMEVSSRLKAVPQVDKVEKFTRILQGFAIIIGIVATFFEYRSQNEERQHQDRARAEQTAKEFRQYFYQKQLEYYAEAAEATAILATEPINSTDYQEARKKFFRLFWGKLSIVEDKSVERWMVRFRDLLAQYEAPGSAVDQDSLQQASLALAHAASEYTLNVWIDSTERKNYNR